MSLFDEIKYDEKGLIPCIVQDITTKEVLMLAYMNEASLKQTLETGLATYWSRSRQAYWIKGETSSHYQHVVNMTLDCDKDTILIQVIQDGAACHTGNRSCFFTSIKGEKQL